MGSPCALQYRIKLLRPCLSVAFPNDPKTPRFPCRPRASHQLDTAAVLPDDALAEERGEEDDEEGLEELCVDGGCAAPGVFGR